MSTARQGADSFTPSLFEPEPEPEPEEERPPTGLFVRVALNRPVRREFTYSVSEGLAEGLSEGARVAVPFGPRRQVGVVVGIDETTDLPARKLRSVLAVLDAEPVVGPDLLELTRWMAERYACSWGEALAAVLPAPLKREARRRRMAMISVPPGVGVPELEQLLDRYPKQHRLLRTLMELSGPAELRDLLRRLSLSDSPARSLVKRGWARIDYVDVLPRLQSPAGVERVRPEKLSSAQENALGHIRHSLDSREHRTFLLQGVTGSGKTEVYLRAIESALEHGRTAIVLVPEIALTPQTLSWFKSRFGEVGVLHSRMSDGERFAEWMRLKNGEARVVVGARSALFAPLADLGVIVVDEEHEPSFKQETTPRYHAREVAVERARRTGAVCILGSATPALESYVEAQKRVYTRLSLPERVGGGAKPSIHVVDMRLEFDRGRHPLFSRLLAELMRETLEAGEQAILFLNRRGFISVLYCPGCSTAVRCHQCSVALTYHRRIDRLVCHQCCEERPMISTCPMCTRPGLRPLGEGSERVETALKKLYPDVTVRRMDSDTMRRREDYEETLAAFERHEVDVLVGTQMIAKGLDFPRVTLVGVISADQAIHRADFRSAERTFQLIAQVAGRAGRGELPGRIVVQTAAPDQECIELAAATDYEGFARHELGERRAEGYPPYGRVVRVVFEDPEEDRARGEAERFAAELKRHRFSEGVEVLGPAVAPLSLVRKRYRWHLQVKAPLGDPGFQRAVDWLAEHSAVSRPQVKVDVDPMSMS